PAPLWDSCSTFEEGAGMANTRLMLASASSLLLLAPLIKYTPPCMVYARSSVSVKWRPPVDGAAVRITMGLLRRSCLIYETAFGNGRAVRPTRAGSCRERHRRPRP